MNFGFEVEAAKSKRELDEDAPTQVSMKAERGLRRNPSTDQKKVRRQMQKRAAPGDICSIHGTPLFADGWCSECDDYAPGHPNETDLTEDPDDRDPTEDDYGFLGQRKHASARSDMDTSKRREVQILSAMAHASFDEQLQLLQELHELRSERTASVRAASETNLADAVIRDHLTPVAVHERSTVATDWLDHVTAKTEKLLPSELERHAAADASYWFGHVSEAVKADRAEFLTQAEGRARHFASAFDGDPRVVHSYVEHCAHLAGIKVADLYNPDPGMREVTYESRDIGYGTESDIVVGEWGPMDTWGKREFIPADGGPPLYLFPDEVIDDVPAGPGGIEASRHRAKDDSTSDDKDLSGWIDQVASDDPGERDEPDLERDENGKLRYKTTTRHVADDAHEQSGEGESNAKNLYEHPATAAPETFDDPVWEETGPDEVPSTRAENVTSVMHMSVFDVLANDEKDDHDQSGDAVSGLPDVEERTPDNTPAWPWGQTDNDPAVGDVKTDEWPGEPKKESSRHVAAYGDEMLRRFEASFGVTAASMTRQHFQHIADSIASAPIPDEHRHALAEHFADRLSDTNINFNKERFLQAATKPMNDRRGSRTAATDPNADANNPQGTSSAAPASNTDTSQLQPGAPVQVLDAHGQVWDATVVSSDGDQLTYSVGDDTYVGPASEVVAGPGDGTDQTQDPNAQQAPPSNGQAPAADVDVNVGDNAQSNPPKKDDSSKSDDDKKSDGNDKDDDKKKSKPPWLNKGSKLDQFRATVQANLAGRA